MLFREFLHNLKAGELAKLTIFKPPKIARNCIFGKSRGSKTAIFAILGNLKMVILVKFSLQKSTKPVILTLNCDFREFWPF